MAVLLCVAILALAGCSGEAEDAGEASKKPTASEAAEPSGPEDPRLQGDPLTEDEVRKELCEQVVAYFPDDMVADASTAASKEKASSSCDIEGVEVGSGVTVKFHASTGMLASNRPVEEIDSKLRSDDSMCNKVLFSIEGQSRFLDVHDATSFGESPDEYCGIKFKDEGHMSTKFIENAQNVSVEMWLDPDDVVEQYDVREEVIPYVMEGVKNFHSDQ